MGSAVKYVVGGMFLGAAFFTSMILTVPDEYPNEVPENVSSEIGDSEKFRRPMLGIPDITFEHYKINSEDIVHFQNDKVVSMVRSDPTKETEWYRERQTLALIESKEKEEKKKEETTKNQQKETEHEDEPSPIKKEEEKAKDNESNIVSNEELSKWVSEASEKYSIPISWILATIKVESDFNANAVNKNANNTVDRGLMQLNENTSPWIAEKIGITYEAEMEFDPATNIEMGTFYLSYLKDNQPENSDPHYIFTAYNRGPSGAEEFYMNQQTYETDHSKKLLKAISVYEGEETESDDDDK